MEKMFKIKERNSTIRTEIIGGLTTFFAMAYIVFVNPNQVAAGGISGWLVVEHGADAASIGQIWNATYIASILVAIIGTLLMAFYAKMPFAQACGMGLNAFFCTTFVAGAFFNGVDVIKGYQAGLVIIFLSGIIFLLLSVTGLREYIAKGMPGLPQEGHSCRYRPLHRLYRLPERRYHPDQPLHPRSVCRHPRRN